MAWKTKAKSRAKNDNPTVSTDNESLPKRKLKRVKMAKGKRPATVRLKRNPTRKARQKKILFGSSNSSIKSTEKTLVTAPVHPRSISEPSEEELKKIPLAILPSDDLNERPDSSSPDRIDDDDTFIGAAILANSFRRSKDIKGIEHCYQCKGLLQMIPSESSLVCPRCAITQENLQATQDAKRYGNETSEQRCAQNKLLWVFLNQFHEDQPHPPHHVLVKVQQEHKKEHGNNPDDIKPTQVKKILKALKMTQYSHLDWLIASLINGNRIPQFTSHEIEQFMVMHKAIQTPFYELNEGTRKNFPVNSYVTLIFAVQRGWEHFLLASAFLKTRNVVSKQKQMVKDICNHINVPFPDAI